MQISKSFALLFGTSVTVSGLLHPLLLSPVQENPDVYRVGPALGIQDSSTWHTMVDGTAEGTPLVSLRREGYSSLLVRCKEGEA